MEEVHYTRPKFVGAHGCTSAQQTSNWQKLTKYGESKGLSAQEINALVELVRRESNFCHLAQNPSSTAFSLFQFLDATWKGVGCIKTSDPDTVIPCGYRYIQNRYGNAQKALQFHNKNNWY